MGDPVTITVYIPALIFVGSLVLLLLVGACALDSNKFNDNAIAIFVVVLALAACCFISSGVVLLVNGATP